jgi:hypothetical protein
MQGKLVTFLKFVVHFCVVISAHNLLFSLYILSSIQVVSKVWCDRIVYLDDGTAATAILMSLSDV